MLAVRHFLQIGLVYILIVVYQGWGFGFLVFELSTSKSKPPKFSYNGSAYDPSPLRDGYRQQAQLLFRGREILNFGIPLHTALGTLLSFALSVWFNASECVKVLSTSFDDCVPC